MKTTSLSEFLKKEEARARREKLEKTFEQQLRGLGYFEGCQTEYRFHDTRKWRFDFAWPDLKLAIEVEGGTQSGRSRHSKGQGFEDDTDKYNTAIRMGWTLFRFTGHAVRSGKAMLFVEDFMKGRSHVIRTGAELHPQA
jgi:very-short-patch-repair endonuclease